MAMAMKDEFTTRMHSELLEGEMPLSELKLWAVFGALKQGKSKAEACVNEGLTVEEWEEGFRKLRPDSIFLK